MKVFDENGNYLGEFIEGTKDKIDDAFEDSWIWGILFLLLIVPGWTILGIVLISIFKFISFILKLIFRTLWWTIRLPFYLIFFKEFPDF